MSRQRGGGRRKEPFSTQSSKLLLTTTLFSSAPALCWFPVAFLLWVVPDYFWSKSGRMGRTSVPWLPIQDAWNSFVPQITAYLDTCQALWWPQQPGVMTLSLWTDFWLRIVLTLWPCKALISLSAQSFRKDGGPDKLTASGCEWVYYQELPYILSINEHWAWCQALCWV